VVLVLGVNMNSLLIKMVQSCVIVCCESSFRKIENSPIKRSGFKHQLMF